MKLDLWLARTGMTRMAFAKKLGVSPATITALCNDEAAWMSRDIAARIADLTEGAVTPNDFIGLEPSPDEDSMSDALSRVKRAIDAFSKGQIIVVTDDDDRENEGDLIVAGSLVTQEQMAFIIRHCCGIVCAPITMADARRLKLDPMVMNNDAPLGTAFTITVDVKHGMTTGISAEERANTVRALANHNMGALDFVRPGHVFPLIAKDGGVLMRSGHTEAAVDLCKLAGLPPTAAICELVNDDGTVKRGAQVAAFAKQHDLAMISVADLIQYRQTREKLVERTGEFAVDTPYGPAKGISYRTAFDQVEHLAVVFGNIDAQETVAVRLHREQILGDVFGKNRSVERSMMQLARQGGVFVYLRSGSAGVPAQSLAASQTTEEHDTARQRDDQWREIGLGAQILRDLGATQIKLLTTRARHYVGLSGFGISIAETETLES